MQIIVSVKTRKLLIVGGTITMKNIVEIVKGSAAAFDIWLRDEDGNPVSVANFDAGKLRFRNCAGTVTEIALTLPGANPDKGKIPVAITSVQSDNADERWASADLILSEGAENTIYPLDDNFKIVEQNAEPDA